MPQYTYCIYDGSGGLEVAVAEADNPDDIRREAVRRAAARLFDQNGHLQVPQDWHLDVVNEEGEVTLRLLYP